ncbi:unnamed protein product [Heligmosomoides polygyrus]|uniref:Secreted protein n=1 Tax=Heligmosomoides polygyrus TaxID=6339 RepID=A0A183FLR2_HELPZ|nr:unnamed protein product [Heligmosomoides polygyrus]
MVTSEQRKTVTAVMVVLAMGHATPMFYSGNAKTQIDNVLVRRRDQGLITDAKTVPYETVATQHRPLICSLKITPPRCKRVERCMTARIKWWRLKEKEAAVVSRIRLPTVTTVEETWKEATDAITRAGRFLRESEGEETAISRIYR